MIFRRALVRELSTAALAVCTALLAISLTVLLARYLGRAASGKILAEGVLALMGFSTLAQLPIVLSLTLFISVLMVLGRYYRDSEMVVWFASGLSPAALIRPVLYFSLPVAGTIAAITLFVAPWALEKSEEYRKILESRDDLSLIAPGVFRESRYADRVFFIESFDEEGGEIHNVFLQTFQNQRLGIVVAKTGVQRTASNGDRFIVLSDGYRYEGTPGQVDYRIVDFERYAMRLEPRASKAFGNPGQRAFPLPQLLRDPSPEGRAELQWRIGVPIAAALLTLVAIPLSFVNPRASRMMNVPLAILIFAIYMNFLSVFQAWIARGKLPVWIGLWPAHIAMGLLLTVMFLHRTGTLRRWKDALRRRRARG